MDPHKRSATIEVMTGDETIVGTDRFDTERDCYAAMKASVKQWPNRVWAIEGAARPVQVMTFPLNPPSWPGAAPTGWSMPPPD